MRPVRAASVVVVCAGLAASVASAQSQRNGEAREAALQRLQDATGGAALVSTHKATGAARVIRLQPGARGGLGRAPAPTARDKQEHSTAFFRDYGAALGIGDPQSLRLVSTATDRLGETHLTWKQFYGAVPVFAATVKTHFDRAHQLKAVTGTAIPDITVDATPTWSSDRAAQVARGSVATERGNAEALRIGTVTLYVYRQGLAQGIPGENHLAWEVEVTDGARVRDFVYVGAHTGKVIDRITAVHDALDRRAYDGHDLAFAPPNYPSGAYWLEGQSFPTASEEANNMILASAETYNVFNQAFGRDSFDGEGAKMDAIFDRGYSCPNASWNGVFISFCPGVTTDDVTAHEWGHAYTQYTHNLIYAWQPGALNEAYSDIWGEVVDLTNGRGGDTPGGGRSAGACSTFSPPVGQLRVNSPASVAGNYVAQSAQFGPPLDPVGVTGEVVQALTGASGAAMLEACSALTNAAAVSGKIALVNRGTCTFVTKVLNAQAAGAIGVIVANNAATGLPGMGGSSAAVTIPSLGVQQAVGTSIRTELSAGNTVNATLRAQPGTDETYRWLMGEDSSPESFNGAIRDMWNPACYSNPGKVTDTAFYVCSTADQGGVHTNSGVPNHGFALLVDGGSYNGQDIAPIGMTKAAHLYFRAQAVYQVEDSDFADHADALEASCQDFMAAGTPLTALTGGPSGETIVASDCEQVAKMIEAVELRTPPTFCNFTPLLNPGLPALCSSTTTSGEVQDIASFNFESDPGTSWAASRTVTSPDFTERDWSWVNALPDGRAGGFFAPNPNIGTCAPGGDESGVLHLTSPSIELPMSTAFARATFDHWVATEGGFDGGNVKISVNGGAWQLVPPSEFTFNNYNALLVSADGGNTNPLAGQPAWTGNNAGTVKGGSWGRSHLNLGNFARAGDTVRLRWDLGSDGCVGSVGWYLDNVNVFSCTPKVPSVSVADIAFAEGDAGRTDRSFIVRLSAATIRPVAVGFEIVDGTAQHGNDFEPGGGGTLVIPAGAASGRITVSVKGDIVPEGNETFFLRLTGVANATIADGEAQATINDDDTTPPGPPGD